MANTLNKGDIVTFNVYIPSCLVGDKPIASYTGIGEYLGQCADGHMTRATDCTKKENIGEIIFTQTQPRHVIQY